MADDAIPLMLATMEERDASVVSGVVPIYFPPREEKIISNCVNLDTGLFEPLWPEADFPAARVGTACMLIQRAVFSAIPYPWFNWQESQNGEVALGEDMLFSDRVYGAGMSIWVSHKARCDHLKEVNLAVLRPPPAEGE